MTKKDYEAVARLFAEYRPHDYDPGDEYYIGRQASWNYLKIGMARIFLMDNPRFDPERFYAACEEATS